MGGFSCAINSNVTALCEEHFWSEFKLSCDTDLWSFGITNDFDIGQRFLLHVFCYLSNDPAYTVLTAENSTDLDNLKRDLLPAR